MQTKLSHQDEMSARAERRAALHVAHARKRRDPDPSKYPGVVLRAIRASKTNFNGEPRR